MAADARAHALADQDQVMVGVARLGLLDGGQVRSDQLGLRVGRALFALHVRVVEGLDHAQRAEQRSPGLHPGM